jgi:uncharacterized membrane protein YfcA
MIVYSSRGDIEWIPAITVGVGSIIGVVFGAKLMMKISAHRLRQIFGLYAIAIALLLFIR